MIITHSTSITSNSSTTTGTTITVQLVEAASGSTVTVAMVNMLEGCDIVDVLLILAVDRRGIILKITKFLVGVHSAIIMSLCFLGRKCGIRLLLTS